jgi:hypothetical protein
MTCLKRNGYKWNINELLQLEREYELLKLPLDAIAQKHQRSVNAIMYKLDEEKIADYNVLYSNYYDLNGLIDENNTQYESLTLNTSNRKKNVKDEVKETITTISNTQLNDKFNNLEQQLNQWITTKDVSNVNSRKQSLYL